MSGADNLISDLTEKVVFLSSLCVILVVGFSQIFIISLRKFSSISSLGRVFFFFNSEMDVGFCQMLCVSTDKIMLVFLSY